jgi:hypothetical protein
VHGSGATITTTASVNTEQQWRLEVREVCRGVLVRTLTGWAAPWSPVTAAWDLRDESGAEVRPGAYTLSLVGADATASTYTWTGTVTVNAARTAAPSVGTPPAPGRSTFVPVDPVEIFDTRDAGELPVGPNQLLNLRVQGVGRLPESGISAVALNLSTACATASTAVTAWPAGTGRPSSASLNVAAGSGGSALAVTALGGDGRVSVLNRSGTTELAVHVVGYYPAEGGQVFRPVKPLRLYDSKRDPLGRLEAGAERTVVMPTLNGVPATAMTGALLNVTAHRATGPGSVTVQGTDSTKTAATLRFAPGATVKNRAVARLVDGAFKVTAHEAGAHVVVDVVGWWAPAEVVTGRVYQPRSVVRVLDTRRGLGVRKARLGAGDVVKLRVAGRKRPVPGSAKAVVMNLTAVSATRSTFVTAWPNGKRRPAYPDLSVPAWRTTANLVVVRIGKKNRVRLTNGSGSTHLVGDVVGYYP